MTKAPTKREREMPKGGRKGGAVFPRVPLADALGYARKLVSKTHTGPQSGDVVMMGVIGSKHDKGTYGMSALKQYGFMTGDMKSGYSASELARKIAAAPSEELTPLYRKAALRPAVFKALFETYHGDTVSKAKLKQRAADLKVHPDETGNCVERYVSTMATARLVAIAGDQVTHLASADAFLSAEATEESNGDPSEPTDGTKVEKSDAAETDANGAGVELEEVRATEKVKSEMHNDDVSVVTPRAVFNVNVTLDASLDVEKLEKQLALLRRYGAV